METKLRITLRMNVREILKGRACRTVAVLGFLKLCDHLGKSELGAALSVRFQKEVYVELWTIWVFLRLCDHLGKSELGGSLSVRFQKVVNVGLWKFWVF